MPKALLFDLDGTLLPVNTDEFVKHYMKALVPHVKDYIEPELFLKALWDSTGAMIKNQEANSTNEEVFTKYFIEMTGVERDEVWPVFDRFYEKHFPDLKQHVQSNPLAKEILEIAKEQGRKIIIATNPVFPKAAIFERLNWLGLLNFPFDLVTVYEESHFCKPQLAYFEEILERVHVKPENAIMIGNDIQEDMVASKLGLDTYLVTDYLIDRGQPQYEVDGKGTLEELKEALRSKQGIFNS